MTVVIYMTNTLGIIIICDENYFRRSWTKKLVKKMSRKQDIAQFYICDMKNLHEVKQKVSRISEYNLYLLSVDLTNEEELSQLKALRERDSLGMIVLFVNDMSYSHVLFSYHLSILDVCELGSSKEKKMTTIEEACDYLMQIIKKKNAWTSEIDYEWRI